MIKVYEIVFYKPIFSLLFYLVELLKDFGLAIIFLAFFVRLILFPVNFQVLKNEQKLKKIQEKIKEELKKNPQKNAKDLIGIYKKEKINPFSNFFLAIIQLPILFSIYQILTNPSFFPSPFFLGVFNLSQKSFTFPFLVLLVLFFTSLKKNLTETFVSLFFGFFTFLILSTLPSAISFYIFFSFLFGIIERMIVLKKHD